MAIRIEEAIAGIDNFLLNSAKTILTRNNKDATGRTNRALRSRTVTGTTAASVELLGPESIFFTIFGRGPGKAPPPGALDEWLEARSLDIDAYLLGQAIARDGTKAMDFGFYPQLEAAVLPFVRQKLESQEAGLLMLTGLTESFQQPRR